MLGALALVCAAAWVLLHWGLSRFVGDGDSPRDMEVLGRLNVGPKRAVMVVRVGSRFLIVGSTEDGLSRLGELSAEEAEEWRQGS